MLWKDEFILASGRQGKMLCFGRCRCSGRCFGKTSSCWPRAVRGRRSAAGDGQRAPNEGDESTLSGSETGCSLRHAAGALVGCSGMWCVRMWGLKIIVLNPSPMSALGVKSPHLQLLRVNKLLSSNPTSSNITSLNSRA